MKFFDSAFSRVHLIVALFAGFNILLGLALRFPIPFFRETAQLHFFAGILAILIPILLLIFLKNRKPVWTSFAVRLSIHKTDMKNKPLLLAKIVSWLFLTSLILFALAGIMIKSGLAAWIFPNVNLLRIHTKGIYLLPPLLILHAVTMAVAYHRKNREAKKYNDRNNRSV